MQTAMPQRAKKRKKPAAAKSATAKKRMRLSPDIRRRQILDAALIEFSALGYTAASISRIARCAGMSKANLYVHFASKDEIFETLLRDLLTPPARLWHGTQGKDSVDEMIDAFIDETYDRLTPQVIAAIRLLISESHRVPDLIQRWHEETVMPAHIEQQRHIDQCVTAGLIDSTPLSKHFGFAMAPVLYAAVTQMVFRTDVAESECRKIRETHRKVMHMLLSPGHTGNA